MNLPVMSTTSGTELTRKSSIEISLNDSIDQLHAQLRRLLENNDLHFSKRKKMLLQFERKHNQHRRSIERTDFERQKKLTLTTDLIRQIKKKLIDEDRQQRQQQREQQEQLDSHRWSLGGMTALVGVSLTVVLSMATLVVIMMLQNSKEKYF